MRNAWQLLVHAAVVRVVVRFSLAKMVTGWGLLNLVQLLSIEISIKIVRLLMESCINII